jgi:hypothetical protein
LTGENWILASGEYSFFNAGAWLGDVPTARLVEVAYFLLHRQMLAGVVEKEVAKARDKAEQALDNALRDSDVTDDGLPAWVAAAQIKPADWKPGDEEWDSPLG